MFSSTPRTEALRAYPILAPLSKKQLDNIELDIEAGKLVLKTSDVSSEGTLTQQIQQIQEIAIQFKILCSTILVMERDGEKLDGPLLAINIIGARNTLLDRVEDLKKNPELNEELRQTESLLREMQMPSLPHGLQEDNERRFERPCPNSAEKVFSPETSQSQLVLPIAPAPKARGLQPYVPLPVFQPRSEAPTKRENKVPTKESLTVEIFESLQKREKDETVCSSSRSTEMSPLTESQLFRRAVNYNNTDYIQKLHEKESDPTLKNSLYHLHFKLLFPEID